MSRLQVFKGGEAMGMGLADYLWVHEGVVCFKKKVILVGKDEKGDPAPLLQRWSFAYKDHHPECLNQADDDCDCPGPTGTRILVPCFFLPDPTRPQPNYLVLCELRDTNDICLRDDYRSMLRKALDQRGPTAKLLWFGFEQDYQLQDVDDKEPGLVERQFLTAERHLGACFDAGLFIHSAWNAPHSHVWDFKVGYRGFPKDLDPDPPSALVVADHLMVAQYLLAKIGGERGLTALWSDIAIFVSTPALREPGQGRMETMRLMQVLAEKGRVRAVPHPVHGGCQCVEMAPPEYVNPYKLALEVLEAVWPLEGVSPAPSEEPEEDQE